MQKKHLVFKRVEFKRAIAAFDWEKCDAIIEGLRISGFKNEASQMTLTRDAEYKKFDAAMRLDAVK